MLGGIIEGITSYAKAFSLISKLKLWKHVMVPALLSFVFGGSILFGAYSFSDNIGGWLVSWYPWERGLSLLTKVATVFGGLLSGVLGLMLYKYVILILVSPFMTPLSQKVEEHLTGKSFDAPFSPGKAVKDIVRGIRVSLRNISKELFFVAILFLLGLIPLLSLFTTALIFLVQAYYVGFGNIDYTLELHFDVKQSRQFVKRNRGFAIGNGVVFLGLLMIGIGFIIGPPLATVAGTVGAVRRLDDSSYK